MRAEPDRFRTYSINHVAPGEAVTRILAAAIQAVDPYRAVQETLNRDGETLRIGDRVYPLDPEAKILVAGAGKAGAPMASAVLDSLGERIAGGCVIVKEGHADGLTQVGPVRLVEAGHPVPDERGVAGTLGMLRLLNNLAPGDLVICLLSGGGSALLLSPIEGLSLAELQDLTSQLLRCGADIGEINTLRKHLDRVKGGQLARLAAPASTASLILSDVIGDPLDTIASGPTAPDPTTFQDALGILEKYSLMDRISPSIQDHLRRGAKGQAPETPKPGDPVFECVQNTIIGSNPIAARAALARAQAEGFNTCLLTSSLQGEARQAGRALAAVVKQMLDRGRPVPAPACVIAGGETTVTLQGSGLGGRNQELALSAAIELAGLPGVLLVSLATDGGDGPTDAAGAAVTGDTLSRAAAIELEAQDFLARNDAYHFFEPLEDLIHTGPTLTNVNDLTFLFAFPEDHQLPA